MNQLHIYQSPYKKFRCGNQKDGGYVMADLPDGYDAFFSGGIANDISFEEDFLSKHPDLICYAFDGTIEKLPKENSKIKFYKKNLGAKNSGFFSKQPLTNLNNEMQSF